MDSPLSPPTVPRRRLPFDTNARLISSGVAVSVVGYLLWQRSVAAGTSVEALIVQGLALLFLAGGLGQAIAGVFWRDHLPVYCRACRREVQGLQSRWGLFCAEGGHYAAWSGSRLVAAGLLVLTLVGFATLVVLAV